MHVTASRLLLVCLVAGAILLAGNVMMVVADMPAVLHIENISQGSEARIRLEIQHNGEPYPNSVHYVDSIEVQVIGRAFMEFKLQPQSGNPFTVELDLGQLEGTPMVRARAHCTLHEYGTWSEAVMIGISPAPDFIPYAISAVAILLVGTILAFAWVKRKNLMGTKRKTLPGNEKERIAGKKASRRPMLKYAGVAAVSAVAGYFISEWGGVDAGRVWLSDATEQNLKNAFSGESQANARYTIFANEAQEEGFSNVARLFTAISFGEHVHARNHFALLNYLTEAAITHEMAGFGPGNTAKNIGIAIEGETFEITEMYPAYREKADRENARDADWSFYKALEAEKTHLELYEAAKNAVDSGRDMQIGKIYICPVCGRAFGDEAPDACPTDGTLKEKFVVY
jgi:rubrerythrin